MSVSFVWRGEIDNVALEALHAEGFEREPGVHDWRAQLTAHSLGWVTANDDDRLVGFVNVVWDGDTHAFLIDTLVAADHRRRGIGTRLVGVAVEETRRAGCEWLHVDFEDHLRDFYFVACGFEPTNAGLIAL
jgi:GNAT superfamily N-acetyltransferase